ncbi:hypothetical protein [Pseudomonas knackmussii]|uniref:glycine-rich domain-containing protein n=1 Tax=Pseudomonas knackmussii TaxID=65741 RepID=UPI003F4A2291
MDRQIVYPGAIPLETDLLNTNKNTMIALAKLAAAMLGTSTIANGFAVTPTTPASLQVLAGAGEIYSLANIDSSAYSSLAADTAHQILKQGILLDAVTLNCPAPTTSGQSINYLVQVAYQDSDVNPVVLPYYNASNPSQAYSGPNNSGSAQYTNRSGAAVVNVKAGASAATGSQVTPSPDSGFVGLYVVTVAYGQTTITAGNIARYSAAPLLPSGLLPAHQSGALSYALDTGAANAYAAAYTPAITALTDGMVLRFKALNANTGASTFNPNGLGAKAIVGGAHAALQGGEIVANSDVWLQYNSSIGGGSWILVDSTGGAIQTANATQSQQAVAMGQLYGGLKGLQQFTSSGSFTVPTGVTTIYASGCAGGGGGGGGGGGQGGFFGSGGGGGGAGQQRIRVPFTVTPGQVISITIGAGGTAGTTSTSAGGAGGAGGNTVIGSLLTLTGGSGGGAGQNGSTVGAVAGASGGSGQPTGGWGGDGNGSAGTACGGVGASNPYGGGGGGGRAGTTSIPAGVAAAGYGSGGGGGGGFYGGGSTATSGGAGGAGAPGIVIIEW